MGFFTITSEVTVCATHVFLPVSGRPIDVELVADPNIPQGMIKVQVTRPRLRPDSLAWTVSDGVLTFAAQEPTTGTIVKNTGNATASGGGFANTGIIRRRDCAPAKPVVDTYTHLSGLSGSVELQQASNAQAKITLTIRDDCWYIIV